MDEYQFTNFRTRSFRFKSFENQPDLFILADVVLASDRSKPLTVVPIFGSRNENIVKDAELHKGFIPDDMYEPFYGEFVHVPWASPLYRIYTDDDAYIGLCSERDVGSFVLNEDLSKRVFNSIRVFCIIDDLYLRICKDKRLQCAFKLSEGPQHYWELGDLRVRYLSKWEPKLRARYKKDYCYIEARDLHR